MFGKSIHLVALCGLCALPILSGCTKGQSEDASASKAPPPAVSVVTAVGKDLPIINNLPGRIAPMRIAEVRPRVSGIVEERVFKQGSHVDKGALLYQIDPAPFEVQVASARAQLEKAKAVQLQARQKAEREDALRKKNVASKQDYDDAVAALAQANAEVDAARANLKSAELSLQYSHVTAPIAGRIGRAQVTEGALVTADSTTSLATIQQLDPIYVDFTQSVGELMQLRRAVGKEGITDPASKETGVKLLFDNGTSYRYPGKLLFSEASVDPETGQVTLRAQFPNPDNDLLPGMYVRVLIQQGVDHGAITVPQQAIQRDIAGNASVDIVKPDDTVAVRKVQLGRSIGQNSIVTSGLKPGERVVVEGFQKIRPGAKVVADAWRDGASTKEVSLASDTKPGDQ